MRQTGLKYLSAILVVTATAEIAQARPVSYPGGWTLMLRNNSDINSAHAHYSIDRKHSFGLRVLYDRDDDFVYTGAQLNRLIKRWNKSDSQANIYGMISAGIVTDETSSPLAIADDAGGFIGVTADWETRRYFVSGSAEYWERGRFGDESNYTGRLGIAPYVAGTGALHTWFMVEGRHKPESSGPNEEDKLRATGLLRFFKGPSLLEIGVDDQGEPMFNYIHRF